MRTLSSICIGLICSGSLAAQSEVPRDQCLGGKLLSIQQDSITTQFNQKIITMRLTPDAEIWRRGVDLESIHQLTLGDQIYLRCTRAADGGAVVASVVAAVEEGDGVSLEPRHITEDRVCVGHLAAIEKDTITVKADGPDCERSMVTACGCTMRINSATEIWRGETLPDTSGLKLGDDIGARVVVDYPSGELIAEHVEANIAKAEGTIVSALPNRIVVADGRWRRLRFTVLFDAHTTFDLDQGQLKKGAMVIAIGLNLGHNTIRASSVLIEK
jgi:hypothetical protein